MPSEVALACLTNYLPVVFGQAVLAETITCAVLHFLLDDSELSKLAALCIVAALVAVNFFVLFLYRRIIAGEKSGETIIACHMRSAPRGQAVVSRLLHLDL